MESEKVKEIKKALEERTQHTPINCSHSEYVEACGIYCRCHRKFVADMGSKNGEVCKDCNKFTATDESKEYADILTLINELESENELLTNKDAMLVKIAELTQENEELTKQCEGWVEIYQKKKKENQQLKDQIAELEKQNAKLLDSVETVQNNRCTTKCELTEKQLKQFGEKLIEKAKKGNYIDKRSHANLTDFIIDIDETLKEFIEC
jgi:DNA-binding transcriptional MerR regulator